MANRSLLWVARRTKAEIGLCALIFLMAASSRADNSWINPNSGNWEDTNSWSLGILPDSSQSILITNAGAKTVLIDLSTVQNYADSTTVRRLTLDRDNVLLLSNTGTNVSLHVTTPDVVNMYSETRIRSNATLAVINSTFINDVYFMVEGGKIGQDGGLVRVGSCFMSGGEYDLTNGTFEIASGDFQAYRFANFNHYGGNVIGSDISAYDGANYYFHSGTIITTDEIGVSGGPDASSEFIQDGGTNFFRAYGLGVGGYDDSHVGKYVLNEGAMFAKNLEIDGYGRFYHNGGTVFVTNDVRIVGAYIDRPRGTFVPGDGSLTVNGGAFTTPATVTLYGADAIFIQQNGMTTASFLSLASLDGQSKMDISGGTFICTNVSYLHDPYFGSGADISQSGGEFRVEGVFNYGGGRRDQNYALIGYARYTFTGGTFYASNIELNAEWIIGSCTNAGRISNPGYFKMAGILDIGDAAVELGRFILDENTITYGGAVTVIASNSIINFTGNNTVLAFAASSSEMWTNGATLLVSNWNGSITGGGNEQLKFGTDASGLSASQLGQIRFINPAGFPAAEYPAQILATGEVVPAERPALSPARNGTNFVLSWTGNSFLQTSTNVAGPYVDISGSTSPFTNDTTGSSERYFRLRQ